MFGDLEKHLLNDWQRDFPLVQRPFQQIADNLDMLENDVLATYDSLKHQGAISRIGAVVRPNVIGASTLAAMAVPPDRLDEVAAHVSSYREVNHNYERDHDYNLWFVVTADCEAGRDKVLRSIEQETGLAVMSLPLAEAYHIDLGFDLEKMKRQAPCSPYAASTIDVDDTDRSLLWELESGLPILMRPYAIIGKRLGMEEDEALDRLRRLIDGGVIRRFGVIVRHHEVGYNANAMVVWDVPDDQVSDVGNRLARHNTVTLCYRRRRCLPDWPYNLFTMIHGTSRDQVLGHIENLKSAEGLDRTPCDVLFSERRFKQKGACYRPDTGSGEKREVA